MDNLDSIGGRLLVVYDGYCGFCNGSIRWLLRRDRRDRLRFVPFDSPQVASLLSKHGILNDSTGSGLAPRSVAPNSILVLRSSSSFARAERVLHRSDAMIALLRALPSPWPIIATALKWIPRPLRDAAYRLIARLRFLIGGRLATCPLPTPEERARFIA